MSIPIAIYCAYRKMLFPSWKKMLVGGTLNCSTNSGARSCCTSPWITISSAPEAVLETAAPDANFLPKTLAAS